MGPRLQNQLEKRSQEYRNWLEEWWLDMIYLQPRYPIATWINWTRAVPASDWNPYEPVSQIESAAAFTFHLLKFRQQLLHETLEPDTLAGQKLCMDQYKHMFNICRIPGIEKDSLQTYSLTTTHIIVMNNNQIIKLQVCDEYGIPFSYQDIVEGFQEAIKLSTDLFELEGHLPLSVLTSEQRDIWAKHRQHLLSICPKNANNLEIIESALFVISLHDTTPVSLQDRSVECLLGYQSTGRGIWNDKPFNMIIFKNGLVGINGEHTWADAMVIVRQLDWVVRSIRDEWKQLGHKPSIVLTNPTITTSKNKQLNLRTQPQRLDFQFDKQIKDATELASMHITKLNSTIELKIMQFPHFGKDFCKRYKIAADFFMQMAIQLAYYRQHGTVVGTYETGHTRLFYHGRTETIRSCSVDSRKFCEIMGPRKQNKSVTKIQREEQYQAFQQAIATHSKTAKESMMGKGIDRHLLGLQILATMELMSNNNQNNISQNINTIPELTSSTIPALFTDPGYLRSKKYLLSTSNVGVGESRSFGGYSPFYAGGYGVCYSIQNTSFNACISHIRNSGTNCYEFQSELEYALLELHDLIYEIHQYKKNNSNIGSKL